MAVFEVPGLGNTWSPGRIIVDVGESPSKYLYIGVWAVGTASDGIQVPIDTAEAFALDILRGVEEAKKAKKALVTAEPNENIVRIVTRYSENEYPSEYVAARVNGEYEWVVTGSERGYSWKDLIEYFTDGEETVVSITPLKEDK